MICIQSNIHAQYTGDGIFVEVICSMFKSSKLPCHFKGGGGDLIFFMFCIENQGALKEYIAQPVDGDLEPKCLSLVVAPATLSGLGQT